MNIKSALVAASISSLLVGCGSDSDDSSSTLSSGSSSLQAVHASVDAPLANVWVNGSAALTGVDYGIGSGYLSVPSGTNSVAVEVQLPAGATATAVPETDLVLEADTNYTVFVVGTVSGADVAPLVVTRPSMGDADGSTLDVQVVHASSAVPDVDLYVTAPAADINSEVPLDTLAFLDSTGVVNIPGGDYQVRLTLAGTKTVAFDSGTVSLPAGAELTIAAIPNENATLNADTEVDPSPIAISPVKLIVLDGSSSSIIYNDTERTEIQVGHLVADVNVVDISLDGSEAVSDVDYKGLTTYIALPADDYDIGVYPDNTPGTLVINEVDVPLGKGMDYGIFAANTLADGIEPLVIETDRRPVATSAKLNVIHGAPAASVVDVYLTATSDISTASPAISGFDFKDFVQGVYVAAGTYFVTVTPTGTKTAAIGPASVTVEDGKVYQAIAIGEDADIDPNSFDLLLTEIQD